MPWDNEGELIPEHLLDEERQYSRELADCIAELRREIKARDDEIERLRAENELWRGIIPFIEKTRNKETRGWDVAAQTRIGSVLLVIWTKVKKAVAPAPEPLVPNPVASDPEKTLVVSHLGGRDVNPSKNTVGGGKAGGDPFFITIQSDDGYTRIPVKPGEEEKAITSFIKMLEDVEGDPDHD